jgi:ribonuclease HIII
MKKIIVRAKLESLAPQRQQYRPYLFNLQPENVIVEIELDEHDVVSHDSEEVVVNMAGFKSLLTKLADAVEEVHDAYVNKARKAGKF